MRLAFERTRSVFCKTHKLGYILSAATLFLLPATSVRAQVTSTPLIRSSTDSATGIIRGRVILPNGGFISTGVKISLQTIRGTESSVFTDNLGAFEFTKLSSGKYQIVVEADKEKFETTTETVEIARGLPAIINIVLKEKSEPVRPKAAAISATELDANVPAKARKEFERASALSKEGKTEESIAHFRNALAIYPQYLMAHNDLGAQLLTASRMSEAEAEFRTAINIDANAFNPRLNLGIVLVKEHKFHEARDVLEKAISLQGQSPAARLFHGLALKGTSENTEAEKELIAAHDLGGAEYAIALFHLGQIFMERADRSLARKYFEQYLKEARNPSNLDEVRKLIAILE